jgi:hypothetical protein
MYGKMLKYKAALIVFLCFIFLLTISCATTGSNKSTITDADIELLSWSSDNSGISHADYTLFTLKAAAAARNPLLNDFLNTLLYKEQALSFSGQTAQEYLDNVKNASAEWNREGHEENFTWEIRGKYLLLKRVFSGGIGSSYETAVSYIIDTALVKRLTIDDIITDSANPDLQGLVWSRLSQTDNFSWIASERASFNQSLKERSFSIFFDGSNLVFHWDKASMAANTAGAFEAVLQRSEILPYLTETGREILN